MSICLIIYNSTRWVGKYNILVQFTKLYSYLLDAHHYNNTNFYLNRLQLFSNSVIKYEKQLNLIKYTIV